MTVSWKLSYSSGTSVDPEWSNYYDIDNPTNTLDQTYTTNRKKYKLYDGSQGRTVPSTKLTYSDVQLSFDYVPYDDVLMVDALVNDSVTTSTKSLETIITDGNKVRIKTHLQNASDKYKMLEGYLTEFKKPWTLGLMPDGGSFKTMFDLGCTLDVTSEEWVT